MILKYLKHSLMHNFLDLYTDSILQCDVASILRKSFKFLENARPNRIFNKPQLLTTKIVCRMVNTV